ncbi:ABC transporter permease [Thermodesulfobacteriota bacterium]
MIRFILKGLIRERQRSLFPILTVAAGTFLVVFLYCWIEGFTDDIVSSNARFDTGHVKVMTRAYEELARQIPNDLSIIGVTEMIARLQKDEPDMLWLPRIRFGGLLDIPDENGETRAQGPVFGLGLDLFSSDSDEVTILNINSALVKGALPKRGNEILISDDFANKLGVKIGETATLLSSTMYGGMTMHNFIVTGTVRFGITAMDRGAIIANISDVQSALDMHDGASEIVGYSKDMLFDDEKMTAAKMRFNAKYSTDEDEFAPIMLSLVEQNSLDSIMEQVEYVDTIIIGIFLFVMFLVLWNSGLMNGLRRYGEIGIRLAVGEGKGTLYRGMIYESLLTGFVGSALGTLFGLLVSYYLQHKGLDLTYLMKSSTMIMNNVMRAKVTEFSYVIGFIPGLFAPLLGSLIAGRGIYKRETAQLFKELEV